MTLLRTLFAAMAVILVAAAGAATGVHAADPLWSDSAKDPASSRAGWSGPYIGIGIGAGAASHDLSLRADGAGEIAGLDGISGEGVFGSIEAGADWQVARRAVIGVLGSVSAAPDDWAFTTEASITGLGTASFEKDWGAMLGLRAGVLLTPDTLAGVHGGWAWTEYSSDPSGLDLEASGPWGGAFIETRIDGGPWRLGLDYRYVAYDGEDLFSAGGLSLEDDLSEHQARLKITYSFN